MLLTIAIDDIPESPETLPLRHVTAAAMTVVRQMQGKATTTEAMAAIARANESVGELRRQTR